MDELCKSKEELATFFQDTDRMFKDDGVPYHSVTKGISNYLQSIFDGLRYGPRWTPSRIIHHVKGS